MATTADEYFPGLHQVTTQDEDRMAEVDSPVLFIVDADQEARLITESALVRRFGADYRVLASGTAQHGLDGLERLADRGDRVALVAADLHLPGMDGVQFLERA